MRKYVILREVDANDEPTPNVRVTALKELFEGAAPFAKHNDTWMDRLADEDRSTVYPVHTVGDIRKLVAALAKASYLLKHAGEMD